MAKKRKPRVIEARGLDRLVVDYKLTERDRDLLLEALQVLSEVVFPGRRVTASVSMVTSLRNSTTLGQYFDQSYGRFGFGAISILRDLKGSVLVHTVLHEFTHAVVAQTNLRGNPDWQVAWEIMQDKTGRKVLRRHTKAWEDAYSGYFANHGEEQRLEEYLCDQVGFWVCARLGIRPLGPPDLKILSLLTAVPYR